jgi:hypothetical protein
MALGSAVTIVAQNEALKPPNGLLKQIEVRVSRRKESILEPLQDSLSARKRT